MLLDVVCKYSSLNGAPLELECKLIHRMNDRKSRLFIGHYKNDDRKSRLFIGHYKNDYEHDSFVCIYIYSNYIVDYGKS